MSALFDRLSGKNPLDDPLVQEWDAIVQDRSDAPACDAHTAHLLRRFQAISEPTLPDDDFFARLEEQILGMEQPAFGSKSRSPESDPSNITSPAVLRLPKRPSSPASVNPWTSVRIAAAVIVLLLVAGLAVLFQSRSSPSEPPPIPAATSAPVLESLVQFDIENLELGVPKADAWTDMELSVQAIDPAVSFSTNHPFYTWLDGYFVLKVLQGRLELQPVGRAYVYRADRPLVAQPVSAGELLHLAVNDAVVFSIKQGASITNPATQQVVAAMGLIGQLDPNADVSYSTPDGVTAESRDYSVDPISVGGNRADPLHLSGDRAHVALQRLELEPLDTYVFDRGPNQHYLATFDPDDADGLRVYSGTVDQFAPNAGHASWKVQSLDIGPNTMVNFGNQSVDLYFFVVEEADDAGTPPA